MQAELSALQINFDTVIGDVYSHHQSPYNKRRKNSITSLFQAVIQETLGDNKSAGIWETGIAKKIIILSLVLRQANAHDELNLKQFHGIVTPISGRELSDCD